MTLVEMKDRYGRKLLNALAQLRSVVARVDHPVMCCISTTHPLAETFHRALCLSMLCGSDHTAADCPIFAEAITGITSATVMRELVGGCPVTAPLAHLFAAGGAVLDHVVFWCADDAFELADLRPDAPHEQVNTWGWRGQA